MPVTLTTPINIPNQGDPTLGNTAAASVTYQAYSDSESTQFSYTLTYKDGSGNVLFQGRQRILSASGHTAFTGALAGGLKAAWWAGIQADNPALAGVVS